MNLNEECLLEFLSVPKRQTSQTSKQNSVQAHSNPTNTKGFSSKPADAGKTLNNPTRSQSIL